MPLARQRTPLDAAIWMLPYIASVAALIVPGLSDGQMHAIWSEARAEAGLPNVSHPTAAQRAFLREFFLLQPGVRLLSVQENGTSPSSPNSSIRCVAYVTVFKAANNAITSALRSAAATLNGTLRHIAGHDDLDDRCPCGATAFTFTFVREPLGHFLSGFAEHAWRENGKEASRRNARRRRTVSIDDAGRALADLLAARKEGVHRRSRAAHHLSLMSGAASGRTLDFVGRLERNETDWRAATELAHLGRVELPFVPHKSSADPQRARARSAERW